MSCSIIQTHIHDQRILRNSNLKINEASHRLTAENFRKRFSDIRESLTYKNDSASSSRTSTPKQLLTVYRRIETATLQKDEQNSEISRKILFLILEAIYKCFLPFIKGIISILKVFCVCIKYALGGFGLISKAFIIVLYYTSQLSLILFARAVEWKSRVFPSYDKPIQRFTENGNYRRLCKLNRVLENKVVKKNFTLVLDLDETLVHVSTIKPNSKYETIEVYLG